MRTIYRAVANPIYAYLHSPRRYRYLFDAIRETKATHILEIGTWNGKRALQMIACAQEQRPHDEICYYGFDLFEDLTEEKFIEEISKHPPQIETVANLLRGAGAKVQLYAGDTVQTLPKIVPTLPPMDFMFIDGGHSLETIAADWENSIPLMKKGTVVIFDDYWNRDDAGAKPIVDAIDREHFDVRILPIQDSFKKDWGVLRINFARVTLR